MERTPRKPFLPSQTCRLLIDQQDRLKYLTIRGVRGDDQRSGGQPANHVSWTDSPWWEFDREALVSAAEIRAPQFPYVNTRGERLTGESKPEDAMQTVYSTQRIILTGDGGTGKSTNLEWLAAHISRTTSYAAFRLPLHTLHRNPTSIERDWLLPALKHSSPVQGGNSTSLRNASLRVSTSESNDARWLRWIDRMKRSGKLILLCDGLDQVAPDSPVVRQLIRVLHSREWFACRVIVAGRPYAIRPLWAELFDEGAGWQVVALDEFTSRQQEALLGKEKFKAIPVEAHRLLTNPRTLDYVNTRLDMEELRQAKSAAFIYDRATRHMLMEGMNNSEKARVLGLNPGEPTPTKVLRRSFDRAQRMLAAIAFEMTSSQVQKEGESVPQPNFETVRSGEEFDIHCESVRVRLRMNETEMDRRLFEHDLDALAALNNELQQGFWDSDADGLEGLSQILWRDRTLQEFYTALHMSKWATEADAALVDKWLYLPHKPATEEYQMIWQFVAEMPDTGRNASSWIRCMQPVYQPGDGSMDRARRSTELLYRSWNTMEQYKAQGKQAASDAIAGFLGEFETILWGKQGRARAEAAREFASHFITVPHELPFSFGTPEHKQGMAEHWRNRWRQWLATRWDNDEQAMDKAPYTYPFQPTKTGREYRERRKRRLAEIHRNNDLQAIEDWFDPKNEYAVDDLVSPATFQLHRYPTLRKWYQLFDPGHGHRQDEWFTGELNQVAPSGDHPQFYVSWYDAWAFCKFAYWNGQSCRLPHEDEWEKAAKGGTQWDWRHWWGDTDQPNKRTAYDLHRVEKSTRPIDNDPEHNENANEDHRNPLGFVDILGNQWEWCEDEYRIPYARSGPDRSTFRVCRGCAWVTRPTNIRSSVRNNNPPSTLFNSVGFRVSRALENS